MWFSLSSSFLHSSAHNHSHALSTVFSLQPQFLFALAQVLGNNAASPIARSAAGLYLKNCLHSKDETINLQLQQRWLQIDPQARHEIKKVVSGEDRVVCAHQIKIPSSSLRASSSFVLCVMCVCHLALPLPILHPHPYPPPSPPPFPPPM